MVYLGDIRCSSSGGIQWVHAESIKRRDKRRPPNARRNLQQRLQTHSIDATQEDQLPILLEKEEIRKF